MLKLNLKLSIVCLVGMALASFSAGANDDSISLVPPKASGTQTVFAQPGTPDLGPQTHLMPLTWDGQQAHNRPVCDWLDLGDVGDWGGSGDGFTLQSLLGDDAPIGIGGWTQFGYHNRSTGLFNSHPGKFNLHQQWLYLEKVADGTDGFDWGFRADVVYGVDAQDTQAFGNEAGVFDLGSSFQHTPYGWAIPQLYAEFAYDNLSVKAGHFFTIIGYEVVTAPDNFFYSHAFTMYNSEPFTHTGFLATYTVDDNLTLYGGWTLGWDTGFNQFGGGSNFLGGASYAFSDDLSATYILTAGNFGQRGEGYSHSIVVDAQLTDEVEYIFQSDYVDTNMVRDSQYGINQYLLYWFNDMVGAGARAEWWKASGTSYYGITFGLNIKPTSYLTIRPEIRHQWSPAANATSGMVTAKNPIGLPVNDGTIFGFDAILTY